MTRPGYASVSSKVEAESVSNSVAASSVERPLIAHIIYRLDVGGLENGLINLINRTPQYRHAIICMTEYTDFSRRIAHDAVSLYAMHKREGKDLGVYLRLWRLLRQMQPDVVHTRNLATLEGHLPALLAGVRNRIHGEHGWDIHDIDGSNRKYQWLRRGYRCLIKRYIPLSGELDRYLRENIRVKADRVTRIYNGVDTACFHPATNERERLPIEDFAPDFAIVIGTVGRMQAVKDPMNLVNAFIDLSRRADIEHERLRLVMIGDGPLRRQAMDVLAAAGLGDRVWLPGSRDDIAVLLRCFDIFVLPSQAEGISNTILEAMASALPVVATRVGGNAELVLKGITGTLVPPNDPVALAEAIEGYMRHSDLRQQHGRAGRERVEEVFSIDGMIKKYTDVYDSMLGSPNDRA